MGAGRKFDDFLGIPWGTPDPENPGRGGNMYFQGVTLTTNLLTKRNTRYKIISCQLTSSEGLTSCKLTNLQYWKDLQDDMFSFNMLRSLLAPNVAGGYYLRESSCQTMCCLRAGSNTYRIFVCCHLLLSIVYENIRHTR